MLSICFCADFSVLNIPHTYSGCVRGLFGFGLLGIPTTINLMLFRLNKFIL